MGLLLTGVFFCVLRAYIGLHGIRQYSHDAFFLLDGAWRMMNGQRPSIDFYSPSGVLVHAPVVLGVWLARGGSEGLAYSQAICGAIFTLWTYLLARRRLADIPAALMFLSILFLTTAPFALGSAPTMTSPATVYNRYGYAILALTLIESLFPSRADFWGGFSTGALAAISLFLKFTYLLAAGILLVGTITARRQTRARWTGMAAGFTVVCLPICFYFGLHLHPMWADTLIGVRAKHVDYLNLHSIANIFDGVGATLMLALSAILTLVAGGERHFTTTIAWTATALAITGSLVYLSNTEPSGFPLLALFAVLIVQFLTTPRRDGVQSPDLLRATVILWALLFIAGSLFSNLTGIAWAGYQKLSAERFSRLSLDSPAFAGFVAYGGDIRWAQMVNDGIGLLRRYRRPGETIMTTDFSNPFSFALHAPPAPGGTTCLSYRILFTKRYHPSGELLFGSADLLMVPEVYSEGNLIEGIPEVYGPFLESHFEPVAQSAAWRLYRRVSH